MAQQNQVAEQQSRRGEVTASELRDFLVKNKSSISRVAQRVLDPERMTSIVIAAATQSPTLLKCDQLTILRSMARAAELGLECNNAWGDAYLVPYYNTKRGCYEAQMQVGYRGMIRLATSTGVAKKIEAQVVYDSDPVFDYEHGLTQKLRHVRAERTKNSKVIAFYCIVVLANGEQQFVVMYKSEVDRIMTRAKANKKGDTPWDTDYDEMGKKSTVRRIFKMIPRPLNMKDDRFYQALTHEDDTEKQRGEFSIPEDAHERLPDKNRGAGALKDQLKGPAGGAEQQEPDDRNPPPEGEPIPEKGGETGGDTQDQAGKPAAGAADPKGDLLGDQQQEQPTRARKGGNARDLPATADHLKQVRDKIKSLDLATEAELCRAMGREKLEGITQGEVIAALTWLDDPAVAYVPPAKPAAQPAKKS